MQIALYKADQRLTVYYCGKLGLVHGGWAGAVVWRQLAPRLRKAGHEVYAPTLTGIGERKHLLSREIGLDTHIQDVIGVIEDEDLSDIVLVGHSYGGMVISGVADRVPEQVASLVSLDAFVPGERTILVQPVAARPGWHTIFIGRGPLWYDNPLKQREWLSWVG